MTPPQRLFPLFSVCLFITCWLGHQPARADESGLKTFVAVDITGEAFRRDKEKKPQEAQVRGAELFFSAPIDSLFDGSLGLAAHPEGGVSHFELHEALVSTSKLIPLTQLRLGQGFLALGKLNATHQHDWPFISAPKVHSTFFDDEGVNDLLFEATTNVPSSVPLAITAGISKGWTYGHAHNAGSRPRVPTHYLRTQTFAPLPFSGGLQLGANYLGRTDAKGEQMRLLGLDLTAKWRDGRRLIGFLQGEFWHRTLRPAQGKTEQAIGFYIFPQTNLFDGLDLGIRGDHFQVLNLQDATGQELIRISHTVMPTLSYKPSEFATFRIAYAWDLEKDSDDPPEVRNGKVELQSTFILGAHPAHDF